MIFNTLANAQKHAVDNNNPHIHLVCMMAAADGFQWHEYWSKDKNHPDATFAENLGEFIKSLIIEGKLVRYSRIEGES